MFNTRIGSIALQMMAFVAALLPAGAQLPPLGNQNANNPTFGQIALGSLMPATVPYKLNQGMITVKASVSDCIPQDAVIATALPLTIISPGLVTKQAFKTGGQLDLATFLGPVKAYGLPS